MLATMLAAGGLAALYVLLIARQVREARATNGPRRRLDRAERDAVYRLIGGDLDRAGYRAEMASLAARDAIGRPLVVPAPEH